LGAVAGGELAKGAVELEVGATLAATSIVVFVEPFAGAGVRIGAGDGSSTGLPLDGDGSTKGLEEEVELISRYSTAQML